MYLLHIFTAQDDGNPFLKDVKDVDILLHHASLPSERQVQLAKRHKQSKWLIHDSIFIPNWIVFYIY